MTHCRHGRLLRCQVVNIIGMSDMNPVTLFFHVEKIIFIFFLSFFLYSHNVYDEIFSLYTLNKCIVKIDFLNTNDGRRDPFPICETCVTIGSSGSRTSVCCP